MQKRVLVITYYWPPSGGAGVQRWLKFIKYFREFGWEPFVYTPSNPEYPVADYSLINDIPENIEIIKQPIREPYKFYKLFTGIKKSEKVSAAFLSENKKPKLSQKISVWLRGNLFIPDARCFWINPSVRFLKNYLINNKIDLIVTTGPPHSLHIIGMKLNKKLNIPWLADFRDPWTNIDYYKDLKLSRFADRKHHKLEKEVLAGADAVITIGKTIAAEFNLIHKRNYFVIPNGYDDADFALGEVSASGEVAKSGEASLSGEVSPLGEASPLRPDKKFSLVYIGSMPKSRNPLVLWKALEELINSDLAFAENIEVKIIGKVDIHIRQSINDYKLDNYIQFSDYVPHNDITVLLSKAQVLLLLINNTPNAKGIITGKFFEYLAAKRPILCIGPTDGEIAGIINNTACGSVVDFDNTEALKAILLNYFALYKTGKLKTETRNIVNYSRRELTKTLTDIFNDLSFK
ncbi:MAG: glycosyltransferase family 4 protein [Bacteroidales bacterium]|nr:glycosyltransferase family 4 protein [Bacteroidales bacterium]